MMARIDTLLAQGFSFSVEMSPPKTDEAAARLDDVFDALAPVHPTFASVTYGAGGSTRERTHDVVLRLLARGDITPMAHLTSVAHSRAELVAVLTGYREAGVQNILALKGDPPPGADGWPAGDFNHAIEVVELVKEVGPFCVGVAAHPEGHPQSPDLATDRKYLAEKLRVADFAVTQFFFRVDDYLGMVEDLAARGVDKPVLPGIMPILNAGSVRRMAELCGAALPAEVIRRVEAVSDDPVSVRSVGVEIACELGSALVDAGAPGLHVYTLNRAEATLEIARALGLGSA
ncbi:MAG: methylenetetrahydrofolate reductase [Actinomycetota bacterium]|nr:methylenetetrahydrofolate reductase [Actinomycetota bacterium]